MNATVPYHRDMSGFDRMLVESIDGDVLIGIRFSGGTIAVSLAPDEAVNVAKGLLRMAIDAEMHDTQPGSEP